MDSDSLYYSLELVAGSGYTLNVEQRTALQTSLVILKKNYKFHRVLFWGKILGLKEDYFIAQGRGENEMQDKKNLYSFNCMDWFLLPPVTDSMIEEVAKATKGRFIGDPTYVYDNVEIRRQGKRDGPIEEEVVTKVNEESRLAVTVHQIDEEVSVVPRGAIVKRPHGLVQINRSFGGLSHSEAGKLDNFLHFSKPKNLKKKSIVEMGDFNPAIDFLDVLSDDIPKGFISWLHLFASRKREERPWQATTIGLLTEVSHLIK
ncbi:radial spoke head protein 9 homolog isoform X2 [Micropterus dolomieu]|uniref:radial spoke head protein 9 homolog isoform X2 n=1 Tax=Micropterus dolomieu TaxID=147949 RepID=UPI001E8EDF00|nr:radial spoke head protein 9 homolog isoform X2 [Micropterus dolomieu]